MLTVRDENIDLSQGAAFFMKKIKLGISACLLGQPVRYDGGHKLDPFLKETLGQYIEFVPICPETALGLGVPREAMRLVGDPEAPRLVTIQSNMDHTRRMSVWAARGVTALEKEELDGFICKSRSPSCGMAQVKVYPADGPPVKRGTGLFVRAFMERFPLLPVEDEERLHDPEQREHFIERIFALRRWRQCLAQGKSAGRLAAFHTAHKLIVLSHSEKHYRLLGRLVAQPTTMSVTELYDRYQAAFLEALALKDTRRKHANVLQHILGYFKKQLSTDEKQEMLERIELYRKGVSLLIVPMTLLHHYVRKYDQPYLKGQVYLARDSVELQLRHHA